MAKRRSLGNPLKKQGMVRDVLPGVVGTVGTLGTTMLVRAYLQPVPGTTSEKVYKWAPLLGVGGGFLGGALLFAAAGGKKAGAGVATAAMVTSGIVGASLLLLDWIVTTNPAGLLAVAGPSNAQPVDAGAAGLGVVVAQYGKRPGMRGRGMGAIVMEPAGMQGRLAGRRALAANQQGQGQVVALQGMVQTGAFGTPQYG